MIQLPVDSGRTWASSKYRLDLVLFPARFHALGYHAPLVAHCLSFDLEALLISRPLPSTIAIPNLDSELQEAMRWILTLEYSDDIASVDLTVQPGVAFFAMGMELNIIDPDTATCRRGDYRVDARDRHPVFSPFDPFLYA